MHGHFCVHLPLLNLMCALDDLDFPADPKICNERHLMTNKFFAIAESGRCNRKPLSQFRSWEDRFDSIDDCCRTRFPESFSECCSATDVGSCVLSGNLKYIPVSYDHTVA